MTALKMKTELPISSIRSHPVGLLQPGKKSLIHHGLGGEAFEP